MNIEEFHHSKKIFEFQISVQSIKILVKISTNGHSITLFNMQWVYTIILLSLMAT